MFYLPSGGAALQMSDLFVPFEKGFFVFGYTDSYAYLQLIGRYISKRTPSHSVCGIVR
jgi:hypothetical protein